MKLVRLPQGSPQWKGWRMSGIGGSDLAAIMGLAPYADATRENLLAEKVTGRERETNFAMRRGTLLEPQARAAYAERAVCVADPVCVEHDDAPWMRVSLDGLCYRRYAVGQPWVLELKCPAWQTHDLALAGIVAKHFLVQCQWQLLVTGLDRLDFASFNPSQRFNPADWLAVVPVEADAEVQAETLGAAEGFWAEVCAARGVAGPALAAGVA